jgi:hypothetical protein
MRLNSWSRVLNHEVQAALNEHTVDRSELGDVWMGVTTSMVHMNAHLSVFGSVLCGACRCCTH